MSLASTINTFGRPPKAYAAEGDAGTPPDPNAQQGPAWVAPVLIAGVLGIIGYAMWANYKIVSGIAKKEGSAGVLKYEGGTAAIGVASHAANAWVDE
jgi:hypothetical protein